MSAGATGVACNEPGMEQTLECKCVPVKGSVFSVIKEKDRSFGNRNQ